MKSRPIILTMANDANNPSPQKTDAEKERLRLALSYSDNTPEEEQREIQAFMDDSAVDLEASLPPYDWGGHSDQ